MVIHIVPHGRGRTCIGMSIIGNRTCCSAIELRGLPLFRVCFSLSCCLPNGCTSPLPSFYRQLSHGRNSVLSCSPMLSADKSTLLLVRVFCRFRLCFRPTINRHRPRPPFHALPGERVCRNLFFSPVRSGGSFVDFKRLLAFRISGGLSHHLRHRTICRSAWLWAFPCGFCPR